MGKLIVRNSLYVWKIILQGPSRDLSGKGVGTNFIAIYTITLNRMRKTTYAMQNYKDALYT